MAIFEHDNKKFDSATGELTFGDMEQLECMGVDWSKFGKDKSVPISAIKSLALVCFRKSDPAVTKEWVDSVPVRKINDIAGFVNDFFVRNFPGGGANS